MLNPLIGMPQGAEWLVILAIVILVFGAAKLPDLARGTGQALRIFKSETKGLRRRRRRRHRDHRRRAGRHRELPPTSCPAQRRAVRR